MIVFANILQPLIDVSEWILTFFHDEIGFGWGASIIGMTVVIRIAILPLTFKGVKGMQELQRLQPQMKRLQERYKDDKQRLQQEMMKLYQEHGVNPISSCLPLLLQFPFFIALFYLLRGEEFAQDIAGEESFLFIPDLAAVPPTGVLIALLGIYVATQFAASAITLVSADPKQRRLMLALPFVFIPVIVFSNFPAGLLVYWITTNVWTIGQQLVVRKLYPKPEPHEVPDDDGVKPARGKPTTQPALVGGGSGDGKTATGKAKSGARPTGGNGGPRKPPPPSPRKKKKRSGRRR